MTQNQAINDLEQPLTKAQVLSESSPNGSRCFLQLEHLLACLHPPVANVYAGFWCSCLCSWTRYTHWCCATHPQPKHQEHELFVCFFSAGVTLFKRPSTKDWVQWHHLYTFLLPWLHSQVTIMLLYCYVLCVLQPSDAHPLGSDDSTLWSILVGGGWELLVTVKIEWLIVTNKILITVYNNEWYW